MPFCEHGGMFREKYFFKGVCRFGVAHTILEWDFYFESRLLCSCAEFTYFYFTILTAINDKNGKQFFVLNYLPSFIY